MSAVAGGSRPLVERRQQRTAPTYGINVGDQGRCGAVSPCSAGHETAIRLSTCSALPTTDTSPANGADRVASSATVSNGCRPALQAGGSRPAGIPGRRRIWVVHRPDACRSVIGDLLAWLDADPRPPRPSPLSGTTRRSSSSASILFLASCTSLSKWQPPCQRMLLLGEMPSRGIRYGMNRHSWEAKRTWVRSRMSSRTLRFQQAADLDQNQPGRASVRSGSGAGSPMDEWMTCVLQAWLQKTSNCFI